MIKYYFRADADFVNYSFVQSTKIVIVRGEGLLWTLLIMGNLTFCPVMGPRQAEKLSTTLFDHNEGLAMVSFLNSLRNS